MTDQNNVTGLYNWRYLFAELKREIYRAPGCGSIEEVSGALTSVSCEPDIIARYGGEEFVVVSTNTDRMGP